jgi:hypothetical protein
MKGKTFPAEWAIKNCCLIYLLVVISIMATSILEAAEMTSYWNPRKNVSQDEINKYAAIVVDYVKHKKGWNIEEYSIQFITILDDAPLASFNVIHNDKANERKINPPTRFGIDQKFEMQVYIQIDEMRIFEDSNEFIRILEESQKNNFK